MVIMSRIEAGRKLAMGLMPTVQGADLVVVALSPAGARVAAEIAQLHEAPLDVITACRLEVPGRARSAFGAVADGSTFTIPERVATLGLPDDYVDWLVARARREVERDTIALRGSAPPVDLHGKVAVLVDDGLSEAVLVAAGAKALREGGAASVIFAAPGAGAELCHQLENLVDAMVLLYEPDAAGACVRDPTFAQVTRVDVRNMVRRSRPDLAAVGGS